MSTWPINVKANHPDWFTELEVYSHHCSGKVQLLHVYGKGEWFKNDEKHVIQLQLASVIVLWQYWRSWWMDNWVKNEVFSRLAFWSLCTRLRSIHLVSVKCTSMQLQAVKTKREFVNRFGTWMLRWQSQRRFLFFVMCAMMVGLSQSFQHHLSYCTEK